MRYAFTRETRGSIWVDVFTSSSDAIDAARVEWNHLLPKERKLHDCFAVLRVPDGFDPDTDDIYPFCDIENTIADFSEEAKDL